MSVISRVRSASNSAKTQTKKHQDSARNARKEEKMTDMTDIQSVRNEIAELRELVRAMAGALAPTTPAQEKSVPVSPAASVPVSPAGDPGADVLYDPRKSHGGHGPIQFHHPDNEVRLAAKLLMQDGPLARFKNKDGLYNISAILRAAEEKRAGTTATGGGDSGEWRPGETEPARAAADNGGEWRPGAPTSDSVTPTKSTIPGAPRFSDVAAIPAKRPKHSDDKFANILWLFTPHNTKSKHWNKTMRLSTPVTLGRRKIDAISLVDFPFDCMESAVTGRIRRGEKYALSAYIYAMFADDFSRATQAQVDELDARLREFWNGNGGNPVLDGHRFVDGVSEHTKLSCERYRRFCADHLHVTGDKIVVGAK